MLLADENFLKPVSWNSFDKLLFDSQFGFPGAPPSELGVLSYAQLMNHYISGAFYPLGGTSEIAFQIIPIIERYGGRVLVDAPVTRILVNERGRANGMCL